MFKIREAKSHTVVMERNSVNGMYTVTYRSGVTVVAKAHFDTGREAHAAFRMSAETFIRNYA